MATTGNNGTIPLPNPFTPLAFLPPAIADKYQAVIYVYVATMAAFTWDWLMSIPDEIRMCRNRRFSPAVVAYFLSRFGTLVYCTLTVIVQAAPVAHCSILISTISVFLVIAMPSSSALFFFRVKGVYCNNRIITVVFGFMWLALFGVSCTIIPAVKGTHIGTTKRCMITSVAPYGSAPIVLNAVNDTIIFIAISVRLVSFTSTSDSFVARIKSFWLGDSLPDLSRALLRGGQLYYFATICLNIVTVILVLGPVEPVFHAMLGVSNFALESAMACRVFRAVRLDMIEDAPGSILVPISPRALRHSSTGQMAPTNEYTLDGRHLERSQSDPVVIEFTKTVEIGEGKYSSREEARTLSV